MFACFAGWFGCFLGWLCFVAGLGKYLSLKTKKGFQFFLIAGFV
jgi:hypothetical protein